MKKLMHILFLSCIKATELIEKKFNFELSFTEKLKLKMHTSMCNACKLYEKQSDIIEKGIAHHTKEHAEPVDVEELKKRITAVLSEKEG
jgi:hypothetical protein